MCARRYWIALLATALLDAPVSARADTNIRIDDFEILSFDVVQTGPGGEVNTQIVPPPLAGHIAAQSRNVQCSVGGQGGPQEVARAQLNAGTTVNDEMTAWVPANGTAQLRYEFGYSADLTVGGTVDRIEVDGTGTAGTTVTIALRDENLDLDASGSYGLSSGLASVPFSDFADVDLENITVMTVIFYNEGTHVIREIRLRGDGSQDTGFVVYAEAASTPPLPSPPIQVEMWDPASSQGIYALDLAIANADAGFLPSLDLLWTQDTAFTGAVGGAVLNWTDFAPFDPTQLAFSVNIAPAGAGWFPELYPPDPFHGPEGVTLVFPVRMLDGPGGNLIGTSEVWMTVDPGPEQATDAMEFVDVVVTQNVGASRSWTDGFTLSFLLQPGAPGVETVFPILEMTWWCDWNTNVPATPVPVSSPRRDSANRLTVVPSVTREGAEIQTYRPFERDTAVLIHDVLGRRVSSLGAESGERSVHWSGRDDAGRSLPAGVYFVHVAGENGRGARVVKLR
ncbi:MAG: hypothetical protein DHS20C21_20980 [Gemmatimonadota bacterium]|nr:MAG: hypothetical protein DHS20C21_20980 [Gemmatimonadota bacterium]